MHELQRSRKYNMRSGFTETQDSVFIINIDKTIAVTDIQTPARFYPLCPDHCRSSRSMDVFLSNTNTWVHKKQQQQFSVLRSQIFEFLVTKPKVSKEPKIIRLY